MKRKTVEFISKKQGQKSSTGENNEMDKFLREKINPDWLGGETQPVNVSLSLEGSATAASIPHANLHTVEMVSCSLFNPQKTF